MNIASERETSAKRYRVKGLEKCCIDRLSRHGLSVTWNGASPRSWPMAYAFLLALQSRSIHDVGRQPVLHCLQIFRIDRARRLARYQPHLMVNVRKYPDRKIAALVFSQDTLDNRNAFIHWYQLVVVPKQEESGHSQRS